MKQLPDLSLSFQRLKTLLELEEKVNDRTIFGYAIKKAFIDKVPNPEIIRTIKEQIRDERKAVENCIPKELVKAIEEYFPEIHVYSEDDLREIDFAPGVLDIEDEILKEKQSKF